MGLLQDVKFGIRMMQKSPDADRLLRTLERARWLPKQKAIPCLEKLAEHPARRVKTRVRSLLSEFGSDR